MSMNIVELEQIRILSNKFFLIIGLIGLVVAIYFIIFTMLWILFTKHSKYFENCVGWFSLGVVIGLIIRVIQLSYF